ncbi:MAG: hypothetical protein LBI74_10120 [Synergistaceae bacterium]|nr:hypothetical protein [Synergistaceae bacterium]
MKYLSIFTIGPVQSFIAQARKLQDLYAGSFLLSHLTKFAMGRAAESGARIVFPNPNQESAPNRFLAIVEAASPEDLRKLADDLEESVRSEFKRIADEVMSHWGLEPNEAFKRQIDSLPQFYWAAEPYDSTDYGRCYINVIKRLGAAKTLRSFTPLSESFGRKCSLSSEYNALFCRDRKAAHMTADAYELAAIDDRFLGRDETLGAAAFVKRCLKFAIPEFKDNFPSVVDVYKTSGKEYKEDGERGGYYAVVKFDGDSMGLWYSEPRLEPGRSAEEFQAYLSGRISGFTANTSRQAVGMNMRVEGARVNNGVVIYAGGEDSLCMVNLNEVFSALAGLREEFGSIDLSEYTEGRLTFSAGVVIAHVKMPLSEVLDWARQSEHRAKESHEDKDSYCLTILKHSGEIIQYCHRFYPCGPDGENGLRTLENLVSILVSKQVSVSFIYQLSREFERIAVSSDRSAHREMFLAEARRILTHAEFENEDDRRNTVEKIMSCLDLLYERESNLADLLQYLRAIAFIARERGGN